MRGVEHAIETGWVGSREWVLDTEPTDGQLQIAHKGRTWFEVTMAGVTAHASQPWKGADAIAAMAECVSRIRTAILAQPAHDELGPSTVTFGQVEGGYRPTWCQTRARCGSTCASCRHARPRLPRASWSAPSGRPRSSCRAATAPT